MAALRETTTGEPVRPGAAVPSALAGGTLIALASAATFGLSGPTAKSLLESGWSPMAVALLRIGGGAIVLLVPAAVVLWRQRRVPRPGQVRRQGWGTVALYGIVAIAGVQVGYFNAVQTLTVGVAMLLEYLAPVLLLGWAWWRTGRRPATTSLVGAGVALVGLALVINLTSGISISLVGAAWGLFAAGCLACYFALSARAGDVVHPVVMAGGGSAVGALAVAAVGALGILPMTASTGVTVYAGMHTSWVLPAVVLILVSTVFAYLTGIAAVRALGTRIASFVGLTEVLFAVLFAWLLLGELPTPQQLLGGVLVGAGIILVRRDRRLT